ncbi:MAG: DNA polymerase III subunit alpha [Candidatus Manganitrophaceae bacterium]|nr:MAG: DNA polymerase III subunit alpha [Candidatus Manganitrophaceae bacterium]
MPKQSFVHLHLHTQYSLLDGASQVDPLLETAKGFGMPAVAITDHGNLFGAIEFYQKAKKAGIKPIIGCEAYLAPRSRFDKEGTGADDDYNEIGGSNPYYHLILLASNEAGYKNLMKLLTIANLEGYYYKPRIDKEVLRKHSEGLIGLSACLRGEIPYLLARGYEKEAVAAAHEYQEIFGKENFFLEIQDNGLELQKTANRQLIDLAQKENIPIVGTNDCHYLHKDDARAHDIMLCLQTGKTVNMPNRMRFETQQLYFKSPEEMIRGFQEIPSAISNTLRIAEMINLDLKFGTFHLPQYEVPAGITREAYLASLAQKGLELRFEQSRGRAATLRPLYEERLKKELDVINKMGYAGYFLIVWDIINYARTSNIPVGPGRGSAAGSLVAYALKITDIDPIEYGLIFERFLNPERITLPDIDMDFCMDRREEVIRHVTQKYGADHVSQIITFGTMAAKAAIRDVARVLELPYAEADKLAKLIPNTLNITLDEALAQEPRLKQAAEADPKVGEVIDLAKRLEGLARHASTHAAGVVISAEPLTEHVPLYRGSKGETMTQYAMGDIEKIGLVKFDFLGLRTLTVIDHAVRLVNEKPNQPHPLEISQIPMDDPETYQILGSGETTGIFQLESAGMRDLLVKMKPENFEDIVAILALYRPGPIGSGMVDDFIKRKRDPKKIQYELSQLAEILKETYGVIVYQEQVMKIANVLAGFSLGDADLLRRAMGKKKPEEMAAQKAKFIEGAVQNGHAKAKAEKIFDLMEYFAGYGFNKSHSAAYALITYQTAYLKAHHPHEFMTAILTSEMGNADKVVKYITECRNMDIQILPPDVNESDRDFTVVPGGIRFGLAAIKNVGSGAVDVIIAARTAQGRFTSLFDFCRKIDLRKVNKRVIEGLIKCGAFDSTGAKRSALMEVLERAMQDGVQQQKVKEAGQMTIFGNGGGSDATAVTDPPLPDVPEWEDAHISKLEKEAVGFYITRHPLTPFIELMKKRSATPTEDLAAIEEDREIRICGVVVQEKVATTKRGDRMAYLRIEDLTGSVEVIVFPDLYQTSSPLFQQDIPLLINGMLDRGDKGLKMKATAIIPLIVETSKTVETSRRDVSTGAPPEKSERTSFFPARPYLIRLSAEAVSPSELVQLQGILQRYPGALPVHVRIAVPEPSGSFSESTIAVDSKLQVDGSERLTQELETRFGKGVVVRTTPADLPF